MSTCQFNSVYPIKFNTVTIIVMLPMGCFRNYPFGVWVGATFSHQGWGVGIGFSVRADFRCLYPANTKTPTCCPSDDNRTKVTNSVTSARSLWWHVGLIFGPRIWCRRRTPFDWVIILIVMIHWRPVFLFTWWLDFQNDHAVPARQELQSPWVRVAVPVGQSCSPRGTELQSPWDRVAPLQDRVTCFLNEAIVTA